MTGDIKPASQMTREKIVRFAGAVQDFNPIHYDDEFARKAGLPGVIAHGPLTFLVALDGLLATGHLAQSGSLKARFRAPVLPGQNLVLDVTAPGVVSLRAAGTEALAGTFANGTVR